MKLFHSVIFSVKCTPFIFWGLRQHTEPLRFLPPIIITYIRVLHTLQHHDWNKRKSSLIGTPRSYSKDKTINFIIIDIS